MCRNVLGWNSHLLGKLACPGKVNRTLYIGNLFSVALAGKRSEVSRETWTLSELYPWMHLVGQRCLLLLGFNLFSLFLSSEFLGPKAIVPSFSVWTVQAGVHQTKWFAEVQLSNSGWVREEKMPNFWGPNEIYIKCGVNKKKHIATS